MKANRHFRVSLGPVVGGMLFCVSILVYWLTCFRTITWWEGSEYALAALTLGIAHPPGSLLLTLIGWSTTRLPLGIPPIALLNAVAGLIAGATIFLLYWLAVRLDRHKGAAPEHSRLALLAGGALCLGIAFGPTVWTYATRFTPYGLTALFTVLIVWALVRWWQAEDEKAWLALALLLLGLDFSVHRTNSLLVPGLLLWVLIRSPRTLASVRSWLLGAAALGLGLAAQLALIPMASRQPYLNGCDPSNWTRFWDYISLKMYGGGWLINLYPRKGAFFSEQMADFWQVIRVNLAPGDGPFGLVGLLPGLLAVYGFAVVWRREKRLALALAALLLCVGLGMVVYLNRPSGFFRSLDRHYLPALMVCSIFVVIGAMDIVAAAARLLGWWKWPATAATLAVVVILPAGQLVGHYVELDNSRTTFTRDFAHNILSTLPPRAILFTGGDNDTWPLLYLQGGESVRPDITVLNLGLLNTPWFVKQVMRQDPEFPFRLADQEIDALAPIPWQDSLVQIAALGRSGDSLIAQFNVTPSMSWGDQRVLLVQDQILVALLKSNQWRRPICFMVSCPLQGREWIAPHLATMGLFAEVTPDAPAPQEFGRLCRILLDRYDYGGYADATVPMDEVSSQMAWNYYSVLLQGLSAAQGESEASAGREALEALRRRLPLERINPPDQLRQAIRYFAGQPQPSDDRQEPVPH